MDPMTMSLIASAVLGAMKSGQDSAANKRRMKIESVRERWSPWTGVHGQMQDSPNGMGTMMQSLAAGAMLGQQFKGDAAPDVTANSETQFTGDIGNPYRKRRGVMDPYTGEMMA